MNDALKIFETPEVCTELEAMWNHSMCVIFVRRISPGKEGLVEVVATSLTNGTSDSIQFDEKLFGFGYRHKMYGEDPDDTYYKGLSETGSGDKRFSEFYGCHMTRCMIMSLVPGYHTVIQETSLRTEETPSSPSQKLLRLVYVGTYEECILKIKEDSNLKIVSGGGFSSERHPVMLSVRNGGYRLHV